MGNGRFGNGKCEPLLLTVSELRFLYVSQKGQRYPTRKQVLSTKNK